jgi:hypothetical protein
MRGIDRPYAPRCDDALEELLRPADAFDHPREVLADPDLTVNEKRAILASWASDACAVEAMPGLRKGAAGSTVSFDDIMDALRELDKLAQAGKRPKPSPQRWARHGDLL